MTRTHVSTVAATLTSAIFTSIAFPITVFANPVTSPAGVAGHGFVRDKQFVPDDPLAGLPNDDEDRQRKPSSPGKKPGGKSACGIRAAPANDREIGDLRAALAFAKKGPLAWPCARSERLEIRLRISIDGEGSITAADTVAGDSAIASAIAQKLLGKAVAPRAAGSTVGVIVLRFAGGK
jgi:hypothetical protein